MGGITQPFFDEGRAEALHRLLTRRFGPLPKMVRQAIVMADIRTLDAPSLDALFLPTASH